MKGKNRQSFIQELTCLGFAFVDITRVLVQMPRQGKHIFSWAKSLFYKNRPLDYGLPWLTYDAISWLDSYLSKEMTVFEWGGGSSTIYFAKRVKLVISVEHDWEWYKSVSNHLTHRFLNKKAECIYKPPRKFGRKERKTYLTNQPKYSEYTFAQYCQTINQYPNNSFDLVLVDGEARNDCLRLAKRKVCAGGYLMLDNSDTLDYRSGMKEIEKWPKRDFLGIGPFNAYSWQTTIWRKKGQE